MARVSFPLHSVQIKMVVIIEVICSRVKKKGQHWPRQHSL